MVSSARSALLFSMVSSLLVGCSDYNFHGDKQTERGAKDSAAPDPEPTPVDSAEPDDSGEPPVDDVCEEQSVPGEAVELNSECYVEYTPGSFTPVVEWYKPSWSVDPGSNNIMICLLYTSPSPRD